MEALLLFTARAAAVSERPAVRKDILIASRQKDEDCLDLDEVPWRLVVSGDLGALARPEVDGLGDPGVEETKPVLARKGRSEVFCISLDRSSLGHGGAERLEGMHNPGSPSSWCSMHLLSKPEEWHGGNKRLVTGCWDGMQTGLCVECPEHWRSVEDPLDDEETFCDRIFFSRKVACSEKDSARDAPAEKLPC